VTRSCWKRLPASWRVKRHLIQRFTRPDDARERLQAQQSSEEALDIKLSADPLVDFCGFLTPLSTPAGLFIGNANIRPMNPRCYLYHACLSLMEARGHQPHMSLTAFGQAVPQTLKEYEIELLKRKTKNGIQTDLFPLNKTSQKPVIPDSLVIFFFSPIKIG